MGERRLAYRISDVMRLAGVSRSQVTRWIRSGELGTLPGRPVMIRARDVERKFEIEIEDEQPRRPKVSRESLAFVRELVR